MSPDDPPKRSARGEFVRLIREYFDIRADDHQRIPYGRAPLSTYRFTNRLSQGTIVVFGRFDSYIEELFPMQLYLRHAGFDVISFDGPGQGAALEPFAITASDGDQCRCT